MNSPQPGTHRKREQLHRREFGRRSFALSMAAAGALTLGTGCNRETNERRHRLHVFNWSDYIDPDVLAEFEATHDALVVYDNYASETELESRLVTGSSGYDVVFPSDRTMDLLISRKLVEPLDHARLTNALHLDPRFLGHEFDLQNEFSLPYFWGTVAVAIRDDFVSEKVVDFAPLFDPKYRSRIVALDDAENMVAVALLHLGLPMNSTDPEHLRLAGKLLKSQVPLVQAYTSDAYKEKLIAGDAWVAVGWNGDLRQAADEEPHIQVINRVQGTMVWLDSMVIPSGAPHAELAHELINFLLDPAIAARNAEFVHFGSPNTAARALLPDELKNDTAIYPPDDVIAKSVYLKSRGAGIVPVEQVWREVRS